MFINCQIPSLLSSKINIFEEQWNDAGKGQQLLCRGTLFPVATVPQHSFAAQSRKSLVCYLFLAKRIGLRVPNQIELRKNKP